MPTLTALLTFPRRKSLLTLYLDDGSSFTLHRTVAQETGLFVGQELSQEAVDSLREHEAFQSALDAAYRFLAHRPRSEAEVRSRLRRRKADPEMVERAIARLQEQRLLDDAAFARQWAENRAAFSPRSQALVRWELRSKGVDQETAEEAVEALDDEAAAYHAAERRAARLKTQDYQEFRKGLWDFLRRRGFSYAVCGRAIERLWRDRSDTRSERDGDGS